MDGQVEVARIRPQPCLVVRRLREAGYPVAFPEEAKRLPRPSDAAAAPAAPPPSPAPALAAEFAPEVEAATQVREAVTGAVRQLMECARTGAAPDLTMLLEVSDTLVAAVTAAPYVVAALTYLRQCDDYTVEHSADVAILMCGIARVLGVPEAELRTVALAGLMHDVGKQRVPPEILLKAGTLTREEFAEMRKHPEYGFEILSACADCPEVVRAVALQHHERLDGSGYPSGLNRLRIQPTSQIAAVADTFDAMVSDRVYRRGLPPRKALLELYHSRGAALELTAVEALVKLIGVYPVGTRVQLKSGECGTVTAPNPEDRTHPIVRIEQDRRGRALAAPYALALRPGANEIVRTLP